MGTEMTHPQDECFRTQDPGIHGSWVWSPDMGYPEICPDPEMPRSLDTQILGCMHPMGSHEVPQILWIGVAVCHSPRRVRSREARPDSLPTGLGSAC